MPYNSTITISTRALGDVSNQDILIRTWLPVEFSFWEGWYGGHGEGYTNNINTTITVPHYKDVTRFDIDYIFDDQGEILFNGEQIFINDSMATCSGKVTIEKKLSVGTINVQSSAWNAFGGEHAYGIARLIITFHYD